MDDILTLLGLSLAMLIGCYIAGIIPLTISLSEEKLKLVTVLGAGLLVGTALAVIVPEGVHALYSSVERHDLDHNHLRSLDVPKAPAISSSKEAAQPNVENPEKEEEKTIHEHSHGILETHSTIGISLVTGFIFMLLVDQIGGNMHSPVVPSDAESVGHSQNRHKITATLGLVVHAAADGIALGAAITLSETHITMIVFVAIMLHKAPAAFGLVSFLLHEGLDRTRIRKHLAIFSVAAPLLTVITYIALSQQSKEALSNVQTTGIAMLFSAGTFLYVATVHVLPEISITHTQHKSADGTVIVREQKGFKKVELFTLVIGALLPLLIALGHTH
uniref:Zinc transporter ZIP9 n=1 Tax=Arion vulgaris TaxID=1028688 RepID=A0A0B6ZG42_9EUPU